MKGRQVQVNYSDKQFDHELFGRLMANRFLKWEEQNNQNGGMHEHEHERINSI